MVVMRLAELVTVTVVMNNVAGLSILVVIVVALFICIITLGTGLAYMHRSVCFIYQKYVSDCFIVALYKCKIGYKYKYKLFP